MLGGEHTLTAGAVAACAARHPTLAILYLDAHAVEREPEALLGQVDALAARVASGVLRQAA
jgi:arginase family enzyme